MIAQLSPSVSGQETRVRRAASWGSVIRRPNLRKLWRKEASIADNSTERMASSHRRPVDDEGLMKPCAVPPCLLEAIRAINPTVELEYLLRFDESALRLYLAHLESSRQPRGRGARWERPGDTRAIRQCRPAEEV